MSAEFIENFDEPKRETTYFPPDRKAEKPVTTVLFKQSKGFANLETVIVTDEPTLIVDDQQGGVKRVQLSALTEHKP